MPTRPYLRDQGWLLPQRLEDVLSADHPVRFVAAFIDEFDTDSWQDMGVLPRGKQDGAPSYDPRLLLGVWVYGFMSGIRSSRKLEAACRESLPYLWLTGRQMPDHNTLWRFYQAHRDGMRGLLKRSVRVAVEAGLVEWAVQAVDGSKIAGNASRDRSYDAAGLRKLLERTDAAILDLEAQNRTDDQPLPPRLPDQLNEAKALHEKVKEALQRVQDDEKRLNLTDGDAVLLKAKSGFVTGYNAQAVASPLSTRAGSRSLLVTAAGVGQGNDQEQLLPTLTAAETNLGRRPEHSLADAGYHSAQNLAMCQEQERAILMPEPAGHPLDDPYHKDAFSYDAESDTYTCPQGQALHYSGSKKDRRGQEVRRYRTRANVCRACPAFGICTNARAGRSLEIGPHDAALKQHRSIMTSPDLQSIYSKRMQIIEPVFGIIKEQQAGRRFLLRGLGNVLSEWTLLLTSFNLRSLAKLWALTRPA